jgi:hypothetical protein
MTWDAWSLIQDDQTISGAYAASCVSLVSPFRSISMLLAEAWKHIPKSGRAPTTAFG